MNPNSGDSRPRFFDTMAKEMCWAKAETVPGRNPDRWRKTVDGHVVCKQLCDCKGPLCFKYEHIVPYSEGGESVGENCQLKGYSSQSSDIPNFTDKELDVLKPENHRFSWKTVAEMLGIYKSK